MYRLVKAPLFGMGLFSEVSKPAYMPPCIPSCHLILHHVIAGDVNHIKIGDNSNVQDNVVVHVAKHNAADRALPTIIGNNVTIGTSHGSYQSQCNSNSQGF